MLARRGPQFEQSRFNPVEHQGIMRQRICGRGKLVLCLARFDHCTIQRFERIGEQRMLVRDAVQPPRRAAQRGKRRVRTRPEMLERGQIA
jgi:hypothetical protein